MAPPITGGKIKKRRENVKKRDWNFVMAGNFLHIVRGNCLKGKYDVRFKL